jgi:hypothetical protein
MANADVQAFQSAANTYLGIGQQQNQRLQQLAQEDYQREQIRLEEEKRALAQREKEKAEDAARERKQIETSVANQRFKEGKITAEKGSAESLAEQARASAMEALKRGQVSYANDFFEQAAKYEQQSLTYKAQERTLQDKKAQDAQELLGTVSDPVSWALAKPKLAEAGINVPAQFSSWSPDTKKWIEVQYGQTKAGIETGKLENRNEALRASIEAKNAKLEADKAKAEQKKANEALSREIRNVEKVPTGKALEDLTYRLSGDEKYDSLDAKMQDTVAIEYNLLTKMILKKNPGMTAIDAEAQAKQDILSRIDEDGNFTPFSMGTTTPTRELSPQDEQALAWANKNKNDPRAKQILNKLGR